MDEGRTGHQWMTKAGRHTNLVSGSIEGCAKNGVTQGTVAAARPWDEQRYSVQAGLPKQAELASATMPPVT